MTVPTTRPRSASPASEDASGTTIWATAVATPTTSSDAARTANAGATALTTCPAATSRISTTINRRRSTRSPSGTSRASPRT